MTDSFYEVLDVADDANQDAIDAAYRERVKEYHPDVSDHPNATDRFRLVSEAHDVLSDPVERRRYDRLGHESYRELSGGAPPSGRPDDTADAGDPSRSPGPDDRGTERRRTEERDGTGRTRRSGHGSETDRRDTDTSRGARDHGRGTDRGGSRGTGGNREAADHGPAGPAGRAARTAAAHPSTEAAVAGARRVTIAAVRAIDVVLRPLERWLDAGESHRWLQVLRSFGSGRILERENAVVVGGVAMYLYPFVLWSLFPAIEALSAGGAAGPLVSLLLVSMAAGSLLLSGIPNVGLLFFGSWGVVLPIVLWRSQQYQLWSQLGAILLAACWLPFLHSLLVLELIRRERGFY